MMKICVGIEAEKGAVNQPPHQKVAVICVPEPKMTKWDQNVLSAKNLHAANIPKRKLMCQLWNFVFN